ACRALALMASSGRRTKPAFLTPSARAEHSLLFHERWLPAQFPTASPTRRCGSGALPPGPARQDHRPSPRAPASDRREPARREGRVTKRPLKEAPGEGTPAWAADGRAGDDNHKNVRAGGRPSPPPTDCDRATPSTTPRLQPEALASKNLLPWSSVRGIPTKAL